MIHVIASIEVNEGCKEAFLGEFRKLIAPVRAEDGCLEYGPTVDVDTGFAAQGGVDENVVTIVEKWESLDALKAHLSAPHMDAYREQVKDLVKGLELKVLQPAE